MTPLKLQPDLPEANELWGILNTLYCYGPLLIYVSGFHTQLLFPASDHDFQGFEGDCWYFCEVITGKNIVEEIESIMGACAEQSSPLWVCIPQKSLSLMISGIQTHLGELHFTQAPMMGFLFFSLFPLWCCCPASSWPLHELIPLINGGGHCQTIRISSCGPRLLHRQSHLLTAGCS